MKGQELEIINNIIEKIKNKQTILRVEYKAYTPWLGGCTSGETISIDRRDGTVRDVCLPDSKGLSGRARWLSRILISTTLNGADEYSKVEGPVAEIFGSTRSASKIIIRVLPRADKKFIINILNKVISNADKLMRTKRKTLNLKELMKIIEEETGSKNYSLLAENPRIALLLMGRIKDKKVNSNNLNNVMRKLPLPPELIKGFTLEIRSRKHNDTIPGAAIAAILLTPLLAGIGASTTRGFGRFCIDNIVYLGSNITDKDLVERTMKFVDCNTIASMESKIINNRLNDLVREIGTKLSMLELKDNSESKQKVRTIRTPKIPIIDRIEAIEVNGDIITALNRINNAVLKQKWKQVINIRPTSPGANLHTWILGLPRYTEKTGGYIVVENKPKIFCSNNNKKLNKIIIRRQSLIHMFPLPSRDAQNNSKSHILIIVYKSYDLSCILDKLYHFGRYIKRYARGRRPGWEEKYHYVSIPFIVYRTSRIPDPCGTMRSEFGGVLDVSKPPTTHYKISSKNDIIDLVIEAAINNIKESLKG